MVLRYFDRIGLLCTLDIDGISETLRFGSLTNVRFERLCDSVWVLTWRDEPPNRHRRLADTLRRDRQRELPFGQLVVLFAPRRRLRTTRCPGEFL